MALYAFDGTWNDKHDTAEYKKNTNVVKFGRAYLGRKAVYQKTGETAHLVEDDDVGYIEGIGKRHGTLGKWIGGAFGVGGRQRIKEMTELVRRKFKEGDYDVDIIGFSRGAALALHFANVITSTTVDDEGGKQVKPTVRFLGLWDLVAAFGIPVNVGPLSFQRINLGYKLKLPEKVTYCFHAIALDEQRPAFRVTRVDNGYQVWFRGVHSDVGGGNENTELSDIPLRWMMAKAVKVGLPVDPQVLDVPLSPNPAADIRPLGGSSFREITKNDRFHYSVSDRVQDARCQKRPQGCREETESDETDRILTTEELKAEAKAS